jgi:autophagy-related protein 16-1
VENENLRSGNITTGSGQSAAMVQQLEKKLLAQQEELTELHKRKGENSQNIIDLNEQLKVQQKTLATKETKLAEQISMNASLKAEVQMLTSSIHELKGLNSILRDEHTALQLAFQSLEDKLRKSMDENRQLVDRLIKYKAKDAEKMNEENETFLK